MNIYSVTVSYQIPIIPQEISIHDYIPPTYGGGVVPNTISSVRVSNDRREM